MIERGWSLQVSDIPISRMSTELPMICRHRKIHLSASSRTREPDPPSRSCSPRGESACCAASVSVTAEPLLALYEHEDGTEIGEREEKEEPKPILVPEPVPLVLSLCPVLATRNIHTYICVNGPQSRTVRDPLEYSPYASVTVDARGTRSHRVSKCRGNETDLENIPTTEHTR